ncbi:hypothetical protein FB45DRAFT_865092 [Roridomyces roridus]|uniref:Uncharacterized protein n=1 Tax=Roridomyces roridus TaxID=1738132 RepID=A0AAD7BYB7_9AGAR|nr:hypothetical protein FB45DRAFT_865092 [Roridomyces roridus]
MSAPTLPTVNIPKLGALLIGALFASVLLGITALQAVFYFKYYGHDPLRLKLMVLLLPRSSPRSQLFRMSSPPIESHTSLFNRLLRVLATIHIGFIWRALWFYLIANYGRSAMIENVPCLSLVDPTTMGREIPLCIGAFKDCFFAYRIFILSERGWFLTAPVVVLVFLHPGKTGLSLCGTKYFTSFTCYYGVLNSRQPPV